MKIITRHKILTLLIGLSTFGVVADELRYKDFEFMPDYNNGLSNEPIPDWLKPRIADWEQYFPIYYLDTGKSQVAMYRINIKSGKDHRQRFNEVLRETQTAGKKLGPVGARETVYANIHGSSMYLIKPEGEILSHGHGGIDYYGCIENKPLYTAPLLADKSEAIFVITGKGNVQNDLIKDNIKISSFDGKTGEIYFERFLELTNYQKRISTHPTIDYVRGFRYKKEDFLYASDDKGRKQYAKMYVKDFGNDDLLDVIFWYRQYYSTLVIDKERKGFIFEKEWFVHYIEKEGGFVEKRLSNENGSDILEDANLAWKDGYPQDNHLCIGQVSTAPMMIKILDPGIAY